MELRDLFPSFYEAAGGNLTKYDFDGSSLWCLLKKQSAGYSNEAAKEACSWRRWLDMELGFGMNMTMTWNGIIDERFKYIFHSLDKSEHLFDLKEDPHELKNIAFDRPNKTAHYRALLIK